MGAVSKYIRIQAPRQRVYDLWRDPSQFPEFMPDVKTVENRGDHWHWEVDGPAGATVQWDSEILEDLPGEKLAWRSINGNVSNSGAVRFDERDGETDLEYAIEFSPPGGKVGEVVAKLFDDPEDKVQRSLEAFKQLVERDAEPRPDGRAKVDADEASPAS